METAASNGEVSDGAVVQSACVGRYDIVEAEEDRSTGGKHVRYTIHVKRYPYSYDIRKRFSEFSELHASLLNSSMGSRVNFSLPPKTLFRCFDEGHLAKRINALNAYLAELCRISELHALGATTRFFEPQLLPEWGSSLEPAKPGILGTIRDISKGGKRSKDTFATVMEAVNEHKQFKQDIAKMVARNATEGEIKARSSAYLLKAAERIRDMMLRNGGFQVKMGQAISAQKAMLPREITDTLAACCDKANSQPLSVIKAQVTLMLGRPLEEVFAHVSDQPLAAASIAQVHYARLHSGEEVILKVVHPGVADTMRADAAFMPYLIKLIERVEPGHGLHPMSVTMESMLKQELDMRREGHNRERLAAVVEHSARSERSAHADVRFPRVYWDLCRDGLMVQEFASRTAALTSQKDVEETGVPYQLAVAELAELFGETAFVHGYLHNDLHPGNVLVRPSLGQRVLAPRTRRLAVGASISAIYLLLALLAAVLLRFLAGLITYFRAWSSALCLSLVLVVGTYALLGCGAAGEKESLKDSLDGLLVRALLAAARSQGLHRRLRGRVERTVARITRDRFELVIIDHGFHTYLTPDFRKTWCKVWAAVGLVDEPLLQEAAAELNLESDEYKVLPLLLALLPYPFWLRREFPSPGDVLGVLQDETVGLHRCRFMDKKMPHLWHLVMRVNGQVSALFQMQYGVTPTTRYEFMRLMTRSALLGLRFNHRPLGELPVPGCLSTADREFFEKELPGVEEHMRAHFRWNTAFKGESWDASKKFMSSLRQDIASEAASTDGAPSEPSATGPSVPADS